MVIFKILFTYIAIYIAHKQEGSVLSGLVVGLIIGHTLDIILQTKLSQLRARKYIQKQNQAYYSNVFLNSVFHLLGKLSAVDGIINKAEIEYVEKLCSEKLKFKRPAKKEAIKIFQNAFRSASSFQYDAAQFYEIHKTQPEALESMLIYLFELAATDGEVSPAEERLLETAAQLFNIEQEKYFNIKLHFQPHLKKQYEQSSNQQKQQYNSNSSYSQTSISDDYYKILGCKRTDSASTIKQQYRKLVSDYHPDKIVAKDLPEDFMKFANEKFKAIQEAYQAIKNEKGFS